MIIISQIQFMFEQFYSKNNSVGTNGMIVYRLESSANFQKFLQNLSENAEMRDLIAS